MITLDLDWREVLWLLQGGMSGSHLRWSVYDDMVNRVWPQTSEQERRNMFLIMRRDLGSYWRPAEWNGHSHMQDNGEGQWRDDISDTTPWMYFRQVLARFNPDNQYAVTMHVKDSDMLKKMLNFVNAASIICRPCISYKQWESDTATVTLRAYKWQDEYYINWSRRCAEDCIKKIEKLEIPDDGTM